jgi:hypothetical protein
VEAVATDRAPSDGSPETASIEVPASEDGNAESAADDSAEDAA